VAESRALAALVLCLALVGNPSSALALEARVTGLQITGTRLWAAIEVRDLLRDKFLDLLREGKAVFVQLQTDLWEDRRVFDRVVLTTPPATYRIDPDAGGGGIVLFDQYGGTSRHADVRQPISLRVELGSADRVEDGATYYLHTLVTAATIDERDIDQAGAALFGGGESARGLAALGRFVFSTLLRMGKYFESAEAEVTSRRISGRDIKAGTFQGTGGAWLPGEALRRAP
jgi:hypothetical protein